MNILFTLGMCVIMQGNDAWLSRVHHIVEVGKHSYLTESRIQASDGWSEAVSDNIPFGLQEAYEEHACPVIQPSKSIK